MSSTFRSAPSSPPLAAPVEMWGTASVHVRADPDRSRSRSFASRSRLEDFVSRVRSERVREGLDYLLEECFAVDQQVEPERLLAWLGSALRRAWTYRGGAKLSFWGQQENPCVMRLQTAEGRALYVNALPAVRAPGTDLYAVARAGAVAGSTPDSCASVAGRSGRWETWFCSDEEFYLRRVGASLPSSSCHLVCLEILAYLNRPANPFSFRVASFLSSYHLKTALLHLLQAHTEAHTLKHTHPQRWDGPCVLERLEEVLTFLGKCVTHRQLLSFWVGNPALEDLQGPALLRSSAPLNLFWALEQSPWAELAQQELQRLRLRFGQLPTTRAATLHHARSIQLQFHPNKPCSDTDEEEPQPSTSGWVAGHLNRGLNSQGFKAISQMLRGDPSA